MRQFCSNLDNRTVTAKSQMSPFAEYFEIFSCGGWVVGFSGRREGEGKEGEGRGGEVSQGRG